MDPTAPEPKRRELAGIEVLRFACAAAVLIFHYQTFFGGAPAAAAAFAAHRPFDFLIGGVYRDGRWAVEVFWAISGYIFYYQYGLAIAERRVGALAFAVRRFARLYPLHLVTLLLVAGEQIISAHGVGRPFRDPNDSPSLFLFQLAMASNWLWWQPFSFNTPIWSVSVEIVVYALFFATIVTMGASRRVAAAAAVGFWLLSHGFYGVVPLKVPALSNWVWVCAAYFFGGGLVQRLEHRAALGGVGLVVALIGIVACSTGYATFSVDTTFPISLGLTAAAAWLGEDVAPKLIARAAFLGDATYGSYLLHSPVQIALAMAADLAGLGRSIFLGPIAFLAYFAGIVALALAVFVAFERPAQRAIRRAADRERRSPLIAPAT